VISRIENPPIFKMLFDTRVRDWLSAKRRLKISFCSG